MFSTVDDSRSCTDPAARFRAWVEKSLCYLPRLHILTMRTIWKVGSRSEKEITPIHHCTSIDTGFKAKNTFSEVMKIRAIGNGWGGREFPRPWIWKFRAWVDLKWSESEPCMSQCRCVFVCVCSDMDHGQSTCRGGGDGELQSYYYCCPMTIIVTVITTLGN